MNLYLVSAFPSMKKDKEHVEGETMLDERAG